MSVQPRNTKVFAALLISMTAGAIVLMALGGNPPSAGAFCLSRYNHLDPVEDVISCRADQSPDNFDYVEICYRGIKGSSTEPPVSPNKLSYTEDDNRHFVIGNDGRIRPTEKWQRQKPIILDRNWHSKKAIRICVITDRKTNCLTDSQRRRTEVLVELLCRKFHIVPEAINYPKGW